MCSHEGDHASETHQKSSPFSMRENDTIFTARLLYITINEISPRSSQTSKPNQLTILLSKHDPSLLIISHRPPVLHSFSAVDLTIPPPIPAPKHRTSPPSAHKSSPWRGSRSAVSRSMAVSMSISVSRTGFLDDVGLSAAAGSEAHFDFGGRRIRCWFVKTVKVVKILCCSCGAGRLYLVVFRVVLAARVELNRRRRSMYV